jgi:integrase
LERFYTRLEDGGLAPATVLQIHRILSRALEVAMQRGYVTRNVATLVDAPSVSQAEIEPLTLDEAQRIVEPAARHRNGTRWSVALALGLRQGEALGLRWQHVNLDTATLTVRWQLRGLPGDTDAPTHASAARAITGPVAHPIAPPTPAVARTGPEAASGSPNSNQTRASARSPSPRSWWRPSGRTGPPSSKNA